MKKAITRRMAALGLSGAAALSAGYLIVPWEGAVKNRDGEHVAYYDAVGIPTACYGQTGRDLYDRVIKVGTTYSEDECIIMLSRSIPKYEREVERYTQVPFASTYQKAALISFAYNVGTGNYSSSTLLKELNKGNHDEACEQLLRWKYAGGKVLPGLVKRRADEKSWCVGDAPYEAAVSFQEIVNLTIESYKLQQNGSNSIK